MSPVYKAKVRVELTPKRAALILIDNWFSSCGSSPWSLDAEEMTYHFTDWDYNVTENRRDKIVQQLDVIMRPFQDNITARISKFND